MTRRELKQIILESGVKNKTSLLKELDLKGKTFVKKLDSTILNSIFSDVNALRERKERKAELKKHSSEFKLSEKEYVDLMGKAFSILRSFNSGYSMGDHKTLYLNGKAFASDDTTSVYSGRASRYTPTYGNISVHLTTKELRGFALIGGVWTYIKKKDLHKKVKPCKVLKGDGSKGSYLVSVVDMWIYHNHHADSIEKINEWISSEVLRLRKIRVSEREIQKAMLRFVGFDDSIKVGNCKIGTNAFIERHNLNKDWGYRIDYLISLEDSYYTRKLLNIIYL